VIKQYISYSYNFVLQVLNYPIYHLICWLDLIFHWHMSVGSYPPQDLAKGGKRAEVQLRKCALQLAGSGSGGFDGKAYTKALSAYVKDHKINWR
jgi:hypothetical protein